MVDSIIIGALVSQQAEVGGIIADLEEQTPRRRADLAHINATLKLFDPTDTAETIRAKSVVNGRSGIFGTSREETSNGAG